jgi:hypothetical protein
MSRRIGAIVAGTLASLLAREQGLGSVPEAASKQEDSDVQH